MVWLLMRLVECLAVAEYSDHQACAKECNNRHHMGQDFNKTISLEHDTPDDSEKVCEWQHRTNSLGPFRHTPEGVHESGKQHGWQEKEERHLDCLQLIVCQGGEGDSDPQIGEDEEKNAPEQKEEISLKRHMENESGCHEHQTHLYIAD